MRRYSWVFQIGASTYGLIVFHIRFSRRSQQFPQALLSFGVASMGGWVLATWSMAGFAFFVFAAANLVPRVYSHHRWCRETFEDYPTNRKAVIPGIF